MAITINGSGTVTGLAVGGLPDGTVDAGTLATDSVTAAKLEASAITGADLPAGSVLQVVQGTTSTSTTTTSTSWVATTLYAAITPRSTTSKILVTFSASAYVPDGSQSAATIYRNAVELTGKTSGIHKLWYDGTRGVGDSGGQYLDSPSLTSEITYKIYIKSINSVSFNFPTNEDTTHTTITLMEIAG